MNRFLLPCLLAICSVGWAQTAPDAEPIAAAEAGEPMRPCPPGGDSPGGADGDSPSSGGEPTGDRPASEPCAEAPPKGGMESAAGPGAAIEEDPAIEASAQDVFKPDEEIPEDYPVPLPADI